MVRRVSWVVRRSSLKCRVTKAVAGGNLAEIDVRGEILRFKEMNG